MKASELLEIFDRTEQLARLVEQPKISFKEALEQSEKLVGKSVCFIGNFAHFVTKGVVVRLMEYDNEYEEWTVSDLDLSDGFQEYFDYHFENWEMENEFSF